jgi:hypothetical protein
VDYPHGRKMEIRREQRRQRNKEIWGGGLMRGNSLLGALRASSSVLLSSANAPSLHTYNHSVVNWHKNI